MALVAKSKCAHLSLINRMECIHQSIPQQHQSRPAIQCQSRESVANWQIQQPSLCRCYCCYCLPTVTSAHPWRHCPQWELQTTSASGCCSGMPLLRKYSYLDVQPIVDSASRAVNSAGHRFAMRECRTPTPSSCLRSPSGRERTKATSLFDKVQKILEQEE